MRICIQKKLFVRIFLRTAWEPQHVAAVRHLIISVYFAGVFNSINTVHTVQYTTFYSR